MVKTKSVYDPPVASDGYRVLVMHYWPRGVAKDKIDVWEKRLGTPPELIKRWQAGRIAWPKFRRAYLQAIEDQQETLAALAARAQEQTITLLCSCKDANRCHRSILAELLDRENSSDRHA